MLIDLNADVGEGSPYDAELLKLVTSANVGCGLHAADADAVRHTLDLAAVAGVVVGAHPGYADREHFGRREHDLTEKQVATSVFYQVGALWALARLARAELRYLKPHGALYHQACREAKYAKPLVACAFFNSFQIVGLPGSALQAAAEKVALPFVAEGFIDRRYRNGQLVPRTEPDAMIDDPKEAVEQAVSLAKDLNVRTLCLHGDTPQAVEFAVKVREALLKHDVTLKAFA